MPFGTKAARGCLTCLRTNTSAAVAEFCPAKEDPMSAQLKTATLSTLLMVSAPIAAMAQGAGSTTPSAPAPGGLRGWVTGHPLTDLFVVLAIIIVVAGTYYMRQRSRA
jgi:hypothetical protein